MYLVIRNYFEVRTKEIIPIVKISYVAIIHLRIRSLVRYPVLICYFDEFTMINRNWKIIVNYLVCLYCHRKFGIYWELFKIESNKH